MAEKIDMEMEWDFLLSIMEKLGFHPKWINWIRICITTFSFSNNLAPQTTIDSPDGIPNYQSLDSGPPKLPDACILAPSVSLGYLTGWKPSHVRIT
jgi:hypothetical protein